MLLAPASLLSESHFPALVSRAPLTQVGEERVQTHLRMDYGCALGPAEMARAASSAGEEVTMRPDKDK